MRPFVYYIHKKQQYYSKECKMATNKDIFRTMERRFKDVSDLDVNLSTFPITKDTASQVKTDKQKSKAHGEVFTPLWLVDEMIGRVSDYDWKNQNRTTMDMCAGYGQFTIRMMRKKFTVLGSNFKLKKFIKHTHNFNEIQLSSCYKLMYIFGRTINLFIGDSRKLTELDENDNGVLFYSETRKVWVNITEELKEIMPTGKFTQDKCDSFVKDVEALMETKNIESKQLNFLEM